MRVGRLFIEHPQSVGETYGQHWLHATSFGVRMVIGGVACLVHALLPFLFCKTGSRVITELNESMVMKRRGQPQPHVPTVHARPLRAPTVYGE